MVQSHSAGKAPWTAEGEEKRNAVRQMFAEIAPTYDLCNGLMSLALHRKWRAYAASRLNLKPGDFVLDACSGTGDFLVPLRKLVGDSGKVIGADFCLPMLERAKDKPADVRLLSDASAMPIRSDSFDGVTVGWGIRNVPDVDAAHRELARLLKPGGRFVSLDMAKPRNKLMASICGWFFNTAIPLLGTLFRQRRAYTYLPKSTAKFLGREELKASMERAGLTDVQYRDLFFGNICVHWGRKG